MNTKSNARLSGGTIRFVLAAVALGGMVGSPLAGALGSPLAGASPADGLPPTFGRPGEVFRPDVARAPGVIEPTFKGEMLAVPTVPMPARAAVMSRVEVVAQMDWVPGNITVTPKGRMLVSAHPFGRPGVAKGELPYIAEVFGAEVGGAEVIGGGVSNAGGVAGAGRVRFIDEPWTRPINPETSIGFSNIIGLRSDPKGIVYMLDMGQPEAAFTVDAGPRLLAPKIIIWDSNTGGLMNMLLLEGNEKFGGSAFTPKSFLQDLAVDHKRGLLYLADSGIGKGFDDPTPAIVVVRIDNAQTRRVLSSHPLVMPEPGAAMVIGGVEVRTRGADGRISVPRVGLNPIAIDAECEWVYFGGMHGTKIYKVRAEDLANDLLTDEQLAAKVSVHGPKGVSDGIAMDAAGNIYVTDVNHSAIGVLDQQGRYRLIAQDEALLAWPDGLSVGVDGYVYATVNQLNRHAALNAGVSAEKAPFAVVRVRIKAE